MIVETLMVKIAIVGKAMVEKTFVKISIVGKVNVESVIVDCQWLNAA